MFEVNKINVSYGKVQALWDVSISVNKGEIFALVGSNGAGKTTVLKTISGLLHPKSGEIKFSNKEITHLPAHKRVELGIVLVPEGRQVFSYMTVLENLLLGAYTRRAWERKEKNLKWVFKLFPRLKERKNQFAGTLSGGEQQMLAIGRGLMAQPTLLLLDEPSLGLAPNLVTKVYEAVEEINKSGITILLVEQNVFLSLEIAHRAAILENGRIAVIGDAHKLLDNEYIRETYMGL